MQMFDDGATEPPYRDPRPSVALEAQFASHQYADLVRPATIAGRRHYHAFGVYFPPNIKGRTYVRHFDFNRDTPSGWDEVVLEKAWWARGMARIIDQLEEGELVALERQVRTECKRALQCMQSLPYDADMRHWDAFLDYALSGPITCHPDMLRNVLEIVESVKTRLHTKG